MLDAQRPKQRVCTWRVCALKGEPKASFHPSGQWHIGWTKKFHETRFDEATRPPTRFPDEWPRPREIAPGFTLAFRIVVPWSSVTIPHEEKQEEEVIWIPGVEKPQGVEIDVVITSRPSSVSHWPGKTSMNTQPIGVIPLANGERAWLVYHVIDIKSFPVPPTGTARFFRESDREKLANAQSVRALLFAEEQDGSRAMLRIAGTPSCGRDQVRSSVEFICVSWPIEWSLIGNRPSVRREQLFMRQGSI